MRPGRPRTAAGPPSPHVPTVPARSAAVATATSGAGGHAHAREELPCS